MGGRQGLGEAPRTGGVQCPNLIGPEGKRPAGGDVRIFLAQRAGRRVPRVGKQSVAGFFLPSVEVSESRLRHVDLAAHLDQAGAVLGRHLQPAGDDVDGGHVGGDVFSGATVSSGGGLYQLPVLVGERDSQAIDLELAQVSGIGGDLAAQPGSPGIELVGSEHVVEAHHGHPVNDRREQHGGRGTDRLGRRSRDQQVGVVGLDDPQLANELVEVGVRDLRRVELVVALVVVRDELAQFLGPRHRVGSVHAVRPVGPARRCHRAIPQPRTESVSAAS